MNDLQHRKLHKLRDISRFRTTRPRQERPLKILILWADDASPNLGVRVLGQGTAELARRVWPDSSITFHNYGVKRRELPIGRIRSLVKERVTSKLGMQEWLGSFDLVIDTRSGDSFSDIYGIHRLTLMSMVADFASQTGTPVVLGPQTIGPFETGRGKALARRTLSRASLVMARDEESARCAAALGRLPEVTTTDVVFALPVPRREPSRDIILNISGLLWNENPHVDAAAYRAHLAELYGRLVSDGRTVALLAHVIKADNLDSDVAAVETFSKSVARGSEVLLPAGLDEVRAAAASASVLIGSRMHACLNALSVGTPIIPLAYSRKFEPLLRGVGWDHTVDLRESVSVTDDVMALLGLENFGASVFNVREKANKSLDLATNALKSLR